MPSAGNRTDQGYLNRLATDRLPKTVVGDIFTKAKDLSTAMSLGRQIPVSINETVITTADTFPEAGQVGGTTLASREGAEKPLQGVGYGTTKSFSPIKLAVVVTVSEEYARENVDALYSQLAGQLSGAIARAADLAVFHNRDAITGAALVGTSANSYINATSNRVELDFTSPSPDLVSTILSGVRLVVSDETKNFDMTAFAAMPSIALELAVARDSSGNQIFTPNFPNSGAGINVNGKTGNLLGVPLLYAKSVKGNLGAYAGTNVKMFGGDWSQMAWGYADQIRVKVTDQATVGGVSMWQTNQIAVLAEATFGWIVNDTTAFVAYDNAVADG
jgi:HK97 family phage major capsid protein